MRRTRATRQPPAFYLRRAVDSILATPVISSVTITSIAVSVLLAGAVLLVGSNVYRLVANWGTQGVDVSIYVEAGIDDARVVELKRQLGGEPGVVSLSYISQDEAWQFLASNLGNSAELLDGLDASVLPASFELTLERSLSGNVLEERLDTWRAIPGIDDVQYNRQWTNRFQGAMDIVRWVAWALGALALIASTIIVGATFQLAVFTRREEMEVMRLVGAVGVVYWGPVLIAGLVEGALGSAAAVGILFLVFKLTAGPLAIELPVLEGNLAFLTFQQYLTLILWGTGLGMAGSWLGLQRFGSWRTPGR